MAVHRCDDSATSGCAVRQLLRWDSPVREGVRKEKGAGQDGTLLVSRGRGWKTPGDRPDSSRGSRDPRWIGGGSRFPMRILAEPAAEADRGRHPGFPCFNVLAGGPGQLRRAFGFVRGGIQERLRLPVMCPLPSW